MFQASHLMRGDVITVSPDDAIEDVASWMRLGRLRQLPVVVNDGLLGEISFLAIVEASLRDSPAGAARAVRDLMQRAEDLAAPDTAPPALVGCLARRGVGFVPVVEPGAPTPRLVGIVTERDLLRLAAAHPEPTP